MVFTHPSQLNVLSVIPLVRTPGFGPLRLAGGIAEHPERERWERELNRFYFACGCHHSAQGLFVALLCGSAWAGYCYFQGIWSVGIAVGVAIASAIAGGIVGKLLGLVRANQDLKQTVRAIQAQWPPDESQRHEQLSCG